MSTLGELLLALAALLGAMWGFSTFLVADSFRLGPAKDQPRAAPVVYHLEQPPATRKELRTRYLPEQLALLEKLNRSDLPHLLRLKVLVVPSRWDLPELEYSPMPRHYPWAEKHPKLLIVHLPGQVFGTYESGWLVRWGPISSGRARDPTPSGFFHLNWKSAGRHSTVNPEWYMRWYYNFGNHEGRAFHAYTLPGYPASHACVRLLERDARWLYQWGETWHLGAKPWEINRYGTPVFIVGQFRFGELPPWRSLEWLAKGIHLPANPFPELVSRAGLPTF